MNTFIEELEEIEARLRAGQATLRKLEQEYLEAKFAGIEGDDLDILEKQFARVREGSRELRADTSELNQTEKYLLTVR